MKRLLLLLALLSGPVFAAGWASHVGATATWDSNATNSDRAADEIAALDLSAEVRATRRMSLGSDDSIHPELHTTLDVWPTYHELSALSGGGGVSWEHKFGLGAYAPVVSAGATADLIGARDPERSGSRGTLTFSVARRLDEASRIALTADVSRIDAREQVYARTAAQTTLEFEHTINERWRCSVAGFWRTGDVISYATPPRPDLVAEAAARVTDTTFGRSLVAYSIDAHSGGGRMTLGRVLDESSALILGYEYRDTSRHTLRYINHVISVSLVHSF